MKASPKPRPSSGTRVSDLLDSLDLQLHRTLKTPDPDQVHDLRVATRRFVQALVVFESSAPGAKGIKNGLKLVMKRSGEVRDLDIAAKFLGESDVESAAEIAAKINDKIQPKRRKAQAKLAATLRQMIRRKSISKWRSEWAPQKDADPTPAIVQAAKRFFDLGDKAHAARSAKRLHRLRIATKKLRYSLELGGLAHPQITELQSALGHIHDFDMIREILSKHRGTKKVLRPAEKKQRKRIQEFRACWKGEFAGTKNRARWTRVMTRRVKADAA
jgi:CHAD domain-containing protein